MPDLARTLADHHAIAELDPRLSSRLLDDADLVSDDHEPRSVLLVDHADTNRAVLRGMLRPASYDVLEARGPIEAMRLLERKPVDLIITELVIPEVSGVEFCRMVRSRWDFRLVPILIVTSVHGVESEVQGIESGADGVLLKPLHPVVVRTRVRALLRNKALTDSLDEAENILLTLAQSVEHRDPFTGAHCARLAAYSVAMGKALGLAKPDLVALHRGGYLHDIGKISIRDSVLFKQGPLDAGEWAEMRSHTARGQEICRPMKSLAPVLPVIRSHHERWDGGGYPDGLRGEEIPLLARVLQVADVYDALTTARAYKPALPHAEAIQILEDEVAKGWRDPNLVKLFADLSTAALRDAHDESALSLPASLSNLNRRLNSRH